jgi:queuine tRNA-ribosyltransferase
MSRMEWDDGFKFEVLAESSKSDARLGKLTTPHGIIDTPAFMPVGTYGAVKGISPDELLDAGAEIILSNALHLEFRPGSDVVMKLGGLHQLMGWQNPILTDSGGFQTYSLAKLMKQNDNGILVQSPIDGTKYDLTPERVVEIQRRLGCDFMMPLDVCTPGKSSRKEAKAALQTTLSWGRRSKEAFASSDPVHGKSQALFGIVQGGTHEDLRQQSIESLVEIDFFAYSIGGLAVGEEKEDTWRIVELCNRDLPGNRIRYLMGAGTPEDLRTAISLGVDLFDCVLPTRNGRKGTVFTSEGKLNLRNAAFRDDPEPIERGCPCYACRIGEDGLPKFSRGAIRHFITTGELLGARLGALHNLTYYLRLMATIRSEIDRNPEK